jgi:hypothetical protein
MGQIFIQEEQWITAGRAQELFNGIFKITPNRLKLWRQGKGEAKIRELRTIDFDRGTILYNKEDIDQLVFLTNQKKATIL